MTYSGSLGRYSRPPFCVCNFTVHLMWQAWLIHGAAAPCSSCLAWCVCVVCFVSYRGVYSCPCRFKTFCLNLMKGYSELCTWMVTESTAGPVEQFVTVCYVSVSVAVKFLWPVGGALMQCFKARKPLWKWDQGGRDGEKDGKEGEDAAAGTDAPLEDPLRAHTVSDIG